jgi:ATP-dependent DNA helicase RecQ
MDISHSATKISADCALDREALGLLRRYFGHRDFRPGQLEVVRSVAGFNDTFVVMPTGGGKSLCYQIPALMMEGSALVISPLIALMHDQVRTLERAGIPGCFINSSLGFDEIRRRMQRAREGAYKLIFVAPERLESPQFLEEMQRVQWSFLAVDEAHCVSEWGHDFRPAYLRIAEANLALGRLPALALTATATPEVQDDIIAQLQMRNPRQFIRGFDRPNLRYIVEEVADKSPRLADICGAQSGGSTLVYCGSRKRVDMFTQALRDYRIPAEAYHAGLSEAYRKAVIERFLSGQTKTVVATNAFGMGVDKPDVRNVVHCDLTLSVEAYYQEAGRAGRDGEEAFCTLLYSPGDRRLMEFFLQCNFPAPDKVEKAYNLLYDSVQAAVGEIPARPSPLDDARLASALRVHPAEAGAIISLLERANILRRGSSGNVARVQFLATRERLREYHSQVPERKRNALNALMRLAGSEAFHAPVEISLPDVWRKHGIPTEEFLEAVRAFEYGRLIRFDAPGASQEGGIAFLMERFPASRWRENVPFDWPKLLARRERAVQKLDAVEHYALTNECKRDTLLRYFGEMDVEPRCGKCSSCRQNERAAAAVQRLSPRKLFLLRQTLSAVAELDGRFGRAVVADVLRGKKSADKVRKFDLHKASTFGAAQQYSDEEVREALNIALAARWIALSEDRYATVFLTPDGAKEAPEAPEPLAVNGYNRDECSHPELLQTARRLRREIAAQLRVGERAVVDDRSLAALVNALPRTLREVKRETRYASNLFLHRFAPVFLAAVEEFLRQKAVQNGDDLATLPESVRRSVEMLRAGETLAAVATKRHIAEATVAQHIQTALEHGVQLERRLYVRDEIYEQTREFLRARPDAFLKDIRAALALDVDWHELRIAAAFARAERGFALQTVNRA